MSAVLTTSDPKGERALALLSTLVLEDGRSFGEAALDQQIEDARRVLDMTGPRRHWLGRGRGGSKSTDGSAMALCAMVTQAPIGAQLYIGANDRDQAALIHSAARGWIRRTSHLRTLFDVKADRIELPDKAVTLTVLPADGPGAWGLLPWWVFLDELAQAKSTANAREFVEALLTALPKVDGSRLLIMTTAGSPLHWAAPMYQAAKDSVRWHVSDWTPENGLAPTPWQDSAELEEARLSLPVASYERLFHNRWTSADEAIWDEDAIDALVRPTTDAIPRNVRRGPYVVTIDLGLVKDRTAVSVSHLEARRSRDLETGEELREGLDVVCDVLRYFEGTTSDPVRLAHVENEVVALARRYGNARIVHDPWQAASMSQSLRERGFHVVPFNFTSASKQRLASTALNLIRDRAWSLPGHPTLVEELRGLRVVERPNGAFAIDHAPSGHDDGFMSAVLGAHHLLESRPGYLTSYAYNHDALTTDGHGRRVPRDDSDPLRFGGMDEREYIREQLDRPSDIGRLAGRR